MIERLTRSKTRSATELDFNRQFRSYKRPPKLAASFITRFCTPPRNATTAPIIGLDISGALWLSGSLAVAVEAWTSSLPA